ncbi:MAG TPA: peptidylprolyl isomerase [Candidatus Paceibacterota bacterium]|nr:peptidylprolyl isomerase [Candidatus Paceibacterota bacterium]HMP18715.1 peptidylprolyl isomerase [Candidatus Paceibacterota bacterium]
MENIKATLKTNLGEIVLELYPNKAPKTVDNFVTLAKSGFYDGTRFHRVIKDFMIQGGDPLSKDISKIDFWGTGGPDYVFEDEKNNVRLVEGVIAMANRGPNTNGSQFFIITAPQTDYLFGKHTGFGKVVEGMDIVFKISSVQTLTQNDRPIEDVVLEKIIIE